MGLFLSSRVFGLWVISVVLVNCLGPYLFPVRREAEPELAAQPAVP